MTRVVAGSVGGRTLQVPPHGTRPTSDRVREALFSRLEHLGVLLDTRVLDLYAGSGALGLEAASRGAAHVTLVESARVAAEVCRRNVAALGLAQVVTVVAERAERFVARRGLAPWDLVLIDPPYDIPEGELATLLAGLRSTLAVGPVGPVGPVVVVERSTRSPQPRWPAGIERLDDRTYGTTRVWFAQPVPAGPAEAPGAAPGC